MYCPDCGTKNAEPTKFCQNCGLNLESSGDEFSTSKTSKSENLAPVQANRTHFPVLDGLEDADVAASRDSLSTFYYLLSFFFWPLGFFLWAFHREQKPESANNILAATLAGMVLMILLFLL